MSLSPQKKPTNPSYPLHWCPNVEIYAIIITNRNLLLLLLSSKAQALVEFGDNLKQMADVKYALDDNVKQNFLEPLHQLQMKDLKEVMVSSHFCPFHSLAQFPVQSFAAPPQKIARTSLGLWLQKATASTRQVLRIFQSLSIICLKNFIFISNPNDEIKNAEEKFAESLQHAQMGMYHLLENDVSSSKNFD